MSQKYALVIGVEVSSSFPVCEQAEDETRHVVPILERIGIPKTNITSLLGTAATKTSIEARVRKLVRNAHADDEIWFLFVGPAFVHDEQTYLAGADTLDDDRDVTAVALRDLNNIFGTSEAAKRLLFDAPEAAADDLRELFNDAANTVCLFGGTESHVGGGRRLWLKLLGDALSGLAPEAIVDGTITAGSLQQWLKAELPRAIRKGVSAPKPQQPELFGDHKTVLANVSAQAQKPKAKLDLKQLKRVVFRGEAIASVKSLTGFQKGFRIPDSASPSAQKMINRIATEDLKVDIEDRFNEIREHLGVKRKDLESQIGTDGVAFIRSPGFDYIVSISINPDDPSSIIWRREVCQISDPDIIRAAGFRTVFGNYLDSLQFDFEKPINVEELVDRIEDNPPPGVKVRVAADGSHCDVTVQGFAGSIHVERASLRILGRPGQSPDSLVEQFFAFHTQFGSRKGLPALRDKRSK